jgi:uncharacterized protein
MPSLLLNVTPIYTALLALMLIPLTVRIVKLRYKHRVSLLDGGQDELTSAIRAHGNFVEYVPLCLLLLAFSELNNAPVWGLHILGATLLIGRLLHAYGIHKKALKPRRIGMLCTFGCLIGGSFLLISTLFLS